MPSQYIDDTYPGPRGVPLEQLPRGLVPPPPYVLEEMEWLKARSRSPWPREYEVIELNFLTLFFYFEGIPIVYRPTDRGPEVFAVGYENVEDYMRNTPEEQNPGAMLHVP